jgi:hypothetical protein
VTIWEIFIWFMWFYIAVVCIWIFITAIVDVFRDPTLNGWAKALWVLFLVVLPFLGVFIYLIARGRHMSERSLAASEQPASGRNVTVSGTNSSAAEIEAAKRLLDNGTITAAEYNALKAKALRTT